MIIIIIWYEVRLQAASENDLCGNQCFAPNLETETHFTVLIVLKVPTEN